MNDHCFFQRRRILKSLPLLAVSGSFAFPAQTPAPLAPRGLLHVTVVDQEAGLQVPARCYLTDAAGSFWSPSDVIVYSSAPERHFVTSGEFWLLLPHGHYTLRVERGLEYRSVTREIDLSPKGGHEQKIELERWIDMNSRGWYSGDMHNHRRWDEMPSLLLSEDLNFAPRLTQWTAGDRAPWVAAPPAGLENIQRVDATHVYSTYDTEFERLGAGPGAMSLIGLPSVVASSGNRFNPPNSFFAEQGRRQGGFVDEEKIVWRDSAALVALGLVDSAGVVNNAFNPHFVATETDGVGYIPKDKPEYDTMTGFPLWTLDVYYRFLNCGFRLPVSAGTASGIKSCPLGYCRVYVHLSGAFGYHEWLRDLKAGRSFATNGPMLFLTVNGKGPGDTLAFAEGNGAPGTYKIQAEAISPREFDHLDILWKGNVIKSATPTEDRTHLKIELEGNYQGTGWFAARVFEKPTNTVRFAQTSPVYVQVGKERGVVSEDAKFFIAWMDREIAFYEKLTGFRSEDDRRTMLELFHNARSVYADLAQG